MRRLIVRACLGIAAAVIVGVVHPGWAPIAFRVAVLYVGALAVLHLVARTGAALPRAGRSSIEQALAERPPEPPRVAELERLERVVALSVSHAGEVYNLLRPLVTEIAAPLLAARGVDLARQPERARELLGEDAWELVLPDAGRPLEPFAPGTTEASLRATVEVLERMAR